MSINMANVKSITLGGVSVKKIENLNGDVLWSSTPELSYISLSGYTTTFYQGDIFSFGGTVTAHYSDSTTANVTSSTTFSGYNMSTIGSQTVTASYSEGGVTKTATYSITVQAVPEYLYLFLVGKAFYLNPTNKTFYDMNPDPTTGIGAGYFWGDGNALYMSSGKVSDSRYQRKITLSGSSITNTNNANYWTGPTSFTGGNLYYNGTDHYIHYGTGTGTSKDFRVTPGSGTLTGVSFGGTSMTSSSTGGVVSNKLIKFADKIYFVRDEQHIAKLNNTTWSVIINSDASYSGLSAGGFWSPDGVNLFYNTASGTSKRWNTTTWKLADATNVTHSISIKYPDNIFKLNNNVYYLAYNSTDGYTIHQLRMNTVSSSTITWDDVTSQFDTTALPNANYSSYPLWYSNGNCASCSCYCSKNNK